MVTGSLSLEIALYGDLAIAIHCTIQHTMKAFLSVLQILPMKESSLTICTSVSYYQKQLYICNKYTSV